jgi:hypothetical protein
MIDTWTNVLTSHQSELILLESRLGYLSFSVPIFYSLARNTGRSKPAQDNELPTCCNCRPREVSERSATVKHVRVIETGRRN